VTAGEGLRIVIGCDDAGLDYKEILKADLEKDARVVDVSDVGVIRDENTAYPHVAVAAARLWPRARPTGRSSSAAPGLA
jgi:ribose 5-phosphate isomerase B